MQGKHTSKMSLGFAFALLLTLQSLQLVSTQSSNLGNGELTPSPVSGIPDEWKRGKGVISPEEELGISSGSMTFSGDDEYQAGNETVRAVTEQYNDNMNMTASPQTTLSDSSNTTKANAISIQENNTSDLVTLNPYLGPSTTNGNHVNLTETDTTTPSPGNSTTTTTTTTTTNTTTSTTSTPAFNTQNSTSTVSGNITTTSPPQDANDTKSPSENSANTTVFTTTTMHTSVVLFNESSTASTTKMNATGGSLDVRGNVDRGLASDIQQQQTKSQAWGAILGIGVGVALVALVVYIIVKRRNYRAFSHRKLVEDMPPEPVLRLDNNEPLDLKFDGFAYYNPGLQSDNIQMTNFPRGQTN
ncbi:hypothetical protein PHYPO_G00145830 [Pangasianodon hypophthalmus]|uniref:Mucin-15 n=1 Tax=Pangasianodon hypophthalmus TaxID=310915 RepID=A0A5N5K4X5_PANHP|nr:hypothetical protein PHYPO_G00145830 [Pangasianodon hypophthalmus]